MFSDEKIGIIWLWKSEFCQFAGLITSTENVQKKFQ
jgi:hypothetical protein